MSRTPASGRRGETGNGAIRTDQEYEQALREIHRLWGASPGSAESARVYELLDKVTDYEDRYLDLHPHLPMNSLLEHMDMTDRGLDDLVSIVGSIEIAMDLLAGRRVIGAGLAARLERLWDLPRICTMGEVDPGD